MSEGAQGLPVEEPAAADELTGVAEGAAADSVVSASVETRSRVLAHDGEPVSDEMASAAAVAAVVAIRQVARAYAANQAAALNEIETKRHDRAGFGAPRRNVRRRLPQAWTQTLGR
ncbi:hypothetical protein [Brevibacterium renqingii]|uniref:hypothetical protein n=1 Tax=Brevibacterium renqingii TaxID=2776916 RepID=UPI001FE88C98|nr:hypothetical protein [Brevibacterium renqingii]